MTETKDQIIAEDLTDIITNINDTISNLDKLTNIVMDLEDENTDNLISKSKKSLEKAVKSLDEIELHYKL